MTAPLRKLLLIAPLTLLFAASCFAQTVAIEGTVIGDDGKPLQGAEIKIDRIDIKGNWKTKTDKKGHYFYGGLQGGSYKITVEVDKVARDTMTIPRTKYGDPNQADFNLQKSKKEIADIQKAADSGQGLSKEVERAMSAEDKAKFEKAQKEREQQMAKNKALNDAFNAGREALAAQQWDNAVTQFQKAAEMDPNQHVVHANLGDAHIGRAKTKAGAEKTPEIEAGIAAYRKALEIKPDDASYHNNFGLALAQGGKFEEAQAELNKAAQLDPAQAGKFYYNLGALLTNAGQSEPATVAFKKAIEVDPNYADAYYQYGISLMGKATLGEGGKMVPVAGTAEAFQKYLELAPTGPNAEAAKALMDSIGAKVETEFGKKKTTPKKK